MLRRSGLLAAMILTALTMGLEFSHVLEWGPKASYAGPLYTQLQESLYLWYGDIGSVIEVLAVICVVALAVAAIRHHAWRSLPVAAAVVEVVALIVFLVVVLPVNPKFPVHGSGAVPANWEALRSQWETGHAIGFVLFAASFILLATAALRASSTDSRGGRSGSML